MAGKDGDWETVPNRLETYIESVMKRNVLLPARELAQKLALDCRDTPQYIALGTRQYTLARSRNYPMWIAEFQMESQIALTVPEILEHFPGS